MDKKLLEQFINLYIKYYNQNEAKITEERQERRIFFQSYTKDRISNLNYNELLKYVEKLWSVQGFAKNKIISKNEEQKLKNQLIDLLYGQENMKIRFDRFINTTEDLGIARTTEILCHTFPDKFMIINNKIYRVFEVLGIPSPDGDINYDLYMKYNKLGILIKDKIAKSLNKKMDLLDADFFYNYVYDNLIPKISYTKLKKSKINNIVNNYIEDYEDYHTKLDKEKLIKQIYNNWNSKSIDSKEMLACLLKVTDNLLKTPNLLTTLVEKEYETIQNMFKSLFSEEEYLVNRVNNFISEENKLLVKYGLKKNYYDIYEISIYLTCISPEKYYICHPAKAQNIANELGFTVGKTASMGIELCTYFELFASIKNYISKNKNIEKLAKKFQNPNILVSDIVEYFSDYNKNENYDNIPNALQKYSNGEYDEEIFKEKVYFGLSLFKKVDSLLDYKKNIIIEGPPGVGKSHCVKHIIYLKERSICDDRILMIQFHPSYTYEDFIIGYKPNKEGFALKGGVFYNFCEQARKDPEHNYYFIIDEINRGNLSKIFGETLMLMEKEYRGKSIKLPYDDEDFFHGDNSFSIPEKMHIIGLMNTADRSLAIFDYALRRRFAFVNLKPAFDEEYKDDSENSFNTYIAELGNKKLINLIKKIKELNEEIKELGEGFKIGHSYFSNFTEDEVTDELLTQIIDYEIVPMLEEYWFDDLKRVKEWEHKLKEELNDKK